MSRRDQQFYHAGEKSRYVAAEQYQQHYPQQYHHQQPQRPAQRQPQYQPHYQEEQYYGQDSRGYGNDYDYSAPPGYEYQDYGQGYGYQEDPRYQQQPPHQNYRQPAPPQNRRQHHPQAQYRHPERHQQQLYVQPRNAPQPPARNPPTNQTTRNPAPNVNHHAPPSPHDAYIPRPAPKPRYLPQPVAADPRLSPLPENTVSKPAAAKTSQRGHIPSEFSVPALTHQDPALLKEVRFETESSEDKRRYISQVQVQSDHEMDDDMDRGQTGAPEAPESALLAPPKVAAKAGKELHKKAAAKAQKEKRPKKGPGSRRAHLPPGNQVDFWKRFSAAVHQDEELEKGLDSALAKETGATESASAAKKQRNSWIKQQNQQKRRWKYLWCSIIAFVVLAGISVGVAYVIIKSKESVTT